MLGGNGDDTEGGISSMSRTRHHGGQRHVLLTLEAAFATMTIPSLLPREADYCDPVALRPASCPVLASASVADPRTTWQVLEAIRGTLSPGVGSGPASPVLATITVDETNSRRVTVNFLRN
jgi:hypothetical protein